MSKNCLVAREPTPPLELGAESWWYRGGPPGSAQGSRKHSWYLVPAPVQSATTVASSSLTCHSYWYLKQWFSPLVNTLEFPQEAFKITSLGSSPGQSLCGVGSGPCVWSPPLVHVSIIRLRPACAWRAQWQYSLGGT